VNRLFLPVLVRNVALITSEQGTSIKDIMAGLHPNEKRFNIFFADSRMEGNNAVESVVKAIDLFENHPDLKFDCILIARGGGSEQSLSVFNEYEICKRVCLSKIPVITAIGHEKDLSAVELCSFLTPSPATPSGIGKYLSQRFKLQSEHLSELLGKIMLKFSTIHSGETEKVNSLLSHIPAILGTLVKSFRERLVFRVKQIEDHVFYSLNRAGTHLKYNTGSILNIGNDRINNESEVVKAVHKRILGQVKSRNSFENTILHKSILRIDLSGRKREISVLQKSILNRYRGIFNTGARIISVEEKKVNIYREYAESNSPQRILERGFALSLDEKGKPLTSLWAFRKSENKKLRFFDGEIFVEEKKTK